MSIGYYMRAHTQTGATKFLQVWVRVGYTQLKIYSRDPINSVDHPIIFIVKGHYLKLHPNLINHVP